MGFGTGTEKSLLSKTSSSCNLNPMSRKKSCSRGPIAEVKTRFTPFCAINCRAASIFSDRSLLKETVVRRYAVEPQRWAVRIRTPLELQWSGWSVDTGPSPHELIGRIRTDWVTSAGESRFDFFERFVFRYVHAYRKLRNKDLARFI